MAAGLSIPVEDGVVRRRPGLRAWLVMLPLVLWLAAFVVLPSLMLVALSFAEQKGIGGIVFSGTFRHYARVFSEPVWAKVVGTSVWYAVLCTGLCLVLGYPVAWFIGRASPRRRDILITLVMIPFWTSFLIRTYAWITILGKEGPLNAFLMAARIIPEPLSLLYTPFASVLGLVYNFLPFMILPIYASVEKLDGSLIDAAHDLGAGPLRAFARVIIPLTAPGIGAGIMLVFVPSIAMFAITTLMGGGSDPTIGEVIYKQFTSGRNQPFGAALGTILLVIFLVSLWITQKLRKSR